MFEIQEVDNLRMTFPGSVIDLMPKREDIPEEFKRHWGTKWNKIFATWFYKGLEGAEFIPKEGVDKNKALRHITTIMHSFEPRQEHKESAVAFLLSEWFEDIKIPEGQLV